MDKSGCGDRLRLCTICDFPTNSVFSIKGLCDKDTGLQWNYYPVVNDSYQIHSYEGYKKHQSISLHEHEWKSEYNGDSFIIRNVDNPVGRMEWEWFEKSCTKERQKRNLTFSHCEFGTEFTCDSGHCVSIKTRCDDMIDCADGSDEDADRSVGSTCTQEKETVLATAIAGNKKVSTSYPANKLKYIILFLSINYRNLKKIFLNLKFYINKIFTPESKRKSF